MNSSLLFNSYRYHSNGIRIMNNLLKQVSPMEYGIMLQGKHKKKKNR